MKIVQFVVYVKCEEVDTDRFFADRIVLISEVQRLTIGHWAAIIGRYMLYILLYAIFFTSTQLRRAWVYELRISFKIFYLQYVL